MIGGVNFLRGGSKKILINDGGVLVVPVIVRGAWGLQYQHGFFENFLLEWCWENFQKHGVCYCKFGVYF
jgi:hypothetical protein